MDKAKRQSNIELLRIMTMCGVIVLHYNNATIGGGLAYAQGINLVILYYLESLFACAVYLFVLISGYFMYTKQKRTLDKPFELLVQVILFGEIFYLLLLLVQHEPFKINDFFKRLIPSNWFVILYITIYFVSPFLNLAIQKIEEEGLLTKFMVILIFLFSIYPTCVDVLGEITRKEYVGLSSIGMYGSQWGYSIINFSLMYIIGACRCRQATREKQEKEERARLHYEKVQRLKLQGFTDWAMQHWAFANDHGQNPQMQLAQRYVAHWPEMREKNVGLLLWGGVGTGKSFMAGCIANALMEQEVAVCMTNFARIMNELNNAFSGRNEVVDRLCRYPLLIIDDFGMERGTEYALEQIYNIIDSRYRSRKPLIVTTNLTLTELKNPQDTAHARIYDRLLELCTPIACTGPSMRKDIGQAKLNLLKTLLA